MAAWIWLNANDYPEYQKTFLNTGLSGGKKEDRTAFRYAVVDLQRDETFDQVPERVELKVSGDTLFRLWANCEFVGVGPASAGGDFLTKSRLDWYYANPYTVVPTEKTLRLFAQVQLSPQVLTEFSYGQGGFWLEGTAYFADGSKKSFGTDETWQVRLNRSYCAPCAYDEAQAPDAWRAASKTGDDRALTDAPVKMLEFDKVLPQNKAQQTIAVRAGDVVDVEFDHVYAGNVGVAASGACTLEIQCMETPGVGHTGEKIALKGAGEYRSFRMHSIGSYQIKVLSAEEGVEIQPCLYFNHYPIEHFGTLQTSDKGLDAIYELCRWTLNICRQTIHLDSPMHQELLACTGDYYIETLMSIFTCGDLSLARGDVLRTAQWLVQNDGRMFHTTYSLIWVQMIELVYRFTADRALVEACKAAILKLLARFETYLDADGIVANPPDYMFVDWMVTDGYSLHHPPKYLGQTVLNAFYYKALVTAAELGEICGWEETKAWRAQAEAFGEAFNRTFYDAQRGLYFDGLPTPDEEAGQYHPANEPKKNFSRYPNILAALYGLCSREAGERLIRQMADDETALPPIQPYFMNFLMEAVEEYDLYDELGMKLMQKWLPSVEACGKGLQEGWYKPEEGYSFDHSHAWGGCPAYFIPAMLTGLKMVEPGYKRITLSPKLLGLERAEVVFPTPYGDIRCSMKKGEEAQIVVPEPIEWSLA